LSDKRELHVRAQTTNASENQNADQNENNNNIRNTNQNQIEKPSTATTPGPLPPKILSRKEWKAKDAIGEMQQHTLQHITIHHTATPQKEESSIEKKMQNLQNFSQREGRLASGKIKPAWADVPYHYYIAVDGQIAEGRDIRYAGDTNTDYDPSGHALIVLEGNFEKEQPSLRQLASLLELLTWLSVNYAIPVSEIKAHNDYASTACPGINLKKLLPTLKQKVADLERGKR
jgi:hypothetical protein